MRKGCFLWRGGFLALAAAAFLLLSSPARAAEKEVKASYTSTSGAFTALWVARDSDSFAKYGVKVDLTYIAGGSNAAAALLSGDVPIALSSGMTLVQARLRGGGILGIATHTYTFVSSLIVDSNIKNAADLKGKALGISRFGTTPHLGTLMALKYLGLKPNTDVAIRQLGGIPEVFSAMHTRAIQGAYLPGPLNLKAEKQGFRELVDLGTLGVPYDQSLLLGSEKLVRRDRPLVLDFLKGYVAGIARAKQDEAFTKKILAKYTKVTDPEILDYSYKMFVQKYLHKAPIPRPEAIQTVLNFIKTREPKAATAKPGDFIAPDLVQELQDSGFINSLYK